MPDQTVPSVRYAPDIFLPPYSFVPGHELPHPVNDPAGHLYGIQHEPPIPAAELNLLPTEPDSRRRALAATLAANSRWLYALDLFNAGFYWEAHEAWESFWNSLGRTTPEARYVQGLIHLAASCVKIREGKPEGVLRHLKRARELLGDVEAAAVGGAEGSPTSSSTACLGLDAGSVAAVVRELEEYNPQCWHTSKTPVVRVLEKNLIVACDCS